MKYSKKIRLGRLRKMHEVMLKKGEETVKAHKQFLREMRLGPMQDL